MDCALLPKNRFFSNLQILIVDAGNEIVDTLTGPKAQIRIFVGKNVNRSSNFDGGILLRAVTACLTLFTFPEFTRFMVATMSPWVCRPIFSIRM